jgi:hypothetical protein
MKRALQLQSPSRQQSLRPAVAHAREPERFTEVEATAYVKVFDRAKNPVRQFREWADRVGVPVKYRVGRKRIYDRHILEAFMAGTRWTQRHRVAG